MKLLSSSALTIWTTFESIFSKIVATPWQYSIFIVNTLQVHFMYRLQSRNVEETTASNVNISLGLSSHIVSSADQNSRSS